MRTMTKRIIKSLCGVLILSLTSLGLFAGAGQAEFRIESFDGSVLNAAGRAAPQAGAHPYEASTEFLLGSKIGKENFPSPDEQLRNVVVDLPPGFIGDPTAIPTCTQEDFADDSICPRSTQIGVARMVFTYETTESRIYNLEPPPGRPALFAFNAATVTVYLDAEVRPDDFGLTIKVSEISQTLPLVGSEVTFWG